MILYDPLGGFVASGKITSKSRHCFLMTRLPKCEDISDHLHSASPHVAKAS
jgi:hypothetical protein